MTTGQKERTCDGAEAKRCCVMPTLPGCAPPCRALRRQRVLLVSITQAQCYKLLICYRVPAARQPMPGMSVLPSEAVTSSRLRFYRVPTRRRT